MMTMLPLALASLVLLLVQPLPPAAEPWPVGLGRMALGVVGLHTGAADFDARLEAVSRSFLGRPFRLSPLGEGSGTTPDPDPIFDTRHFDCVTYVEEVIALSWFPAEPTAVEALQQLRYAHGEIRYGARNHLMMAQWIPHNVAAGFVSDVTREVAGVALPTAELVLRPEDYLGREGRALRLEPRDQPTGRFELPVIPPELMATLVGRIPHGTLVTTVRALRPGVPYRETHVGLVVVVGGERRIRHAAQAAGRVVESPLRAYVERAARERAWPVTGFHLLGIAKRPPAGLLAQLEHDRSGPTGGGRVPPVEP
jgi:hypothetical protein